jgi:hypothetical protein
MPAMHEDVLDQMLGILATKKDLMLRLVPFDMTHDECINLVAPSEHIPMLKEAAKIADINASEGWVNIQVPDIVDGEHNVGVALYMRTHAQKTPPLRPRNPWWQLPAPGVIEAGDKVIAWCTKRLEIGRRFGTANYVLQQLNNTCENGTQLRFMLPVVMHLCKPGMSPRMDKWVEKYAAFKACRHTPAVSPQLKKAIQDTSALLTSCALIGDDVPERASGEVDIDISGLPTFTVDERSWSRM